MNKYGVAQTIKDQIGMGALMCLGAHDFAATGDGAGALVFKARILPFTKGGKRSTRPRIMHVSITLNALDLYDVDVFTYDKRLNIVPHYNIKDIDFTQLPMLMLALDYDGDEVLNPRYL